MANSGRRPEENYIDDGFDLHRSWSMFFAPNGSLTFTTCQEMLLMRYLMACVLHILDLVNLGFGIQFWIDPNEHQQMN